MDEKGMSKIGILTYWQYNYGSILQCYATCKVVNDFGYEPIVFSEIPEFKGRVKQKLLVWSRLAFYPRYRETIHRLQEAPCKAINNLDSQTQDRMNEFIDEHIPAQKKTITQWKKEVAGSLYTAFLVGSDQVWSGYRYTSVNNYFLRFVPAYKRIAWAPSFGTSDVADYNVRAFTKYISQIPALSAREKDGVELIRQLTGRECKQLIDPVYLLTAEEWHTLITPNQHGQYTLCYFLDHPNDATLKKVEEYCVSHECKPLVIGKCLDWIGKLKNVTAVSCGPDEFVSHICHANCLFTDSFHGVSFSLILHTPFFAFHRNYTHGTDQSSRLLSILQMCGFETMYEPIQIDEVEFDFTASDRIIQKKREEMLEFLKESLNAIEMGK